MRILSSLFLLTLLFCEAVIAQVTVFESGGELTPELAAFDITFYELDLTINPSDSTVSGHVDIHFKMVQPNNRIELALDPRLSLHAIETIKNGEIDGDSPLTFTRIDTSRSFYLNFPVTLQRGTKKTVRVRYSGKPRVAPNPPWDGGMVWDTTSSGQPWVGVATQMTGAWTWWPQKDHPSDKADSVAINLTMPGDLVVASNGTLRNKRVTEDGWKRWEWFVSTPINNYNITLNAAPYEIIRDTYTSISGDEMEIIFWILPEFMEQGEWLFPQFAEQLRFFEEILGPYPFRADKYGVAHAPYLGMEHQTLIAYGASFENNNMFGVDAGFDDLHQHELAHEWWGNLVSAWDWRDFWIHEGFGAYMQPLYAEFLGGDDVYREMMELIRSRIIENTDMEVAPRQSMSTLDITRGARGGNVYFKGAWFLHTLRYYIGDDHFFELLRRFAYPTPESEAITDGSHVRFATTDDFLTLAENITGLDLEWLFEIYLRQPLLPELHATRRGGVVTLEWKTPGNSKFPMPVEVKIGDQVMTLVPDHNRISFEADNSLEIEADPNHRILKKFILNNEQVEPDNRE